MSEIALSDEFYAALQCTTALSQAERALLEPHLQEQTFVRNTFLLRAGERWRMLYFIQSGLVRLFYLDTEGREFNKAFFGAGQMIWPVAPRDRNEPILFYIAALEATTLLACPLAPLQAVLRRNGQWAAFALPFAETLVEQKFRREHDFLLLSAKERYVQFVAANPEIVHRIPDYHLASYLGMTNVTLSRIKRTLDFNK